MERLLVFADFDWLDKPELVGELCYETTIPACNTLSLGMIFSAVFQMHCPTGGGAPCSKEENKYRHQKKRGLSEIFLRSTISWASMTTPEWADSD